MTIDSRQLITVEEAARRLSLSRSVVYRLMRDHELDDVKIGRSRRIVADSVDDYIGRKVSTSSTRDARGRRVATSV